MIKKISSFNLTLSRVNLFNLRTKKKKIPPLESYILKKKKEEELASDLNIKNYRKTEISRGYNEKPIPCSPRIGPIKLENLKISSKKYKWCSCGLSLTQVFNINFILFKNLCLF